MYVRTRETPLSVSRTSERPGYRRPAPRGPQTRPPFIFTDANPWGLYGNSLSRVASPFPSLPSAPLVAKLLYLTRSPVHCHPTVHASRCSVERGTFLGNPKRGVVPGLWFSLGGRSERTEGRRYCSSTVAHPVSSASGFLHSRGFVPRAFPVTKSKSSSPALIRANDPNRE